MRRKNPAPTTLRSDAEIRRRGLILDAAREELAKRGYDGVTMEGLATRSGVTRKTLYNQFGSKDQLLLAAVSEIIEGYRSLDLDVEPGIPALLESRRKAVRQVVATPEYADAMTRAIAQAPSDHSLVDLLYRQGIRFASSQLRVAELQGELVDEVDIDEMAEQISAHSWGASAHALKDVIALDRFEQFSLSGLLILLLSVTKGARRRSLERLLQELRGAASAR